MGQKTFCGVIPAALSPFDAQGRLDMSDLESHLRYLFGTPGVRGVTVNGHAGEVASLTEAEQREILAMACRLKSPEQFVVAGVYGHCNADAIRIASMAVDAGADALLVFPPEVWEFGVSHDSRLALSYYDAVASAADLPLVAFVYPTDSPLHLSPQVIVDLCARFPVSAVKDWSNDARVYAQILYALREHHPEVSLLTSHSRSLLSTLAMDADGILSGHGSLIPELQVALFDAVQRNDIELARSIARDIHQLTEVFYAPPTSDGFTRMKYASAELGRMKSIGVRGPLEPLTEQSRRAVDEVLPLLRVHAGALQ